MLGDLVAGYGSSESDGAEADAELSSRAPATQPPAQPKPAPASAPGAAATSAWLAARGQVIDPLTNITNALCQRSS
jgi:predicted flap endonuclease-1-like 5' DNA nuclease